MVMDTVYRFGQSVCWFFLLCSNVWAADRLTVVTEHWPPFNYINEHGEVDGRSTAIVREVLKEANIAYKIKQLSWTRAYNTAKDKKNVLIYTIFRQAHREKHFQWICPLIQTSGVKMFGLSSRKDLVVNKLEDAKQYRLGVYGTGWTMEYLKSNGFEIGVHLDVATNETLNIKKLLAGRVDFIVQEQDMVHHRLKTMGVDINQVKAVFPLVAVESQEGCMAMSKDTPKETVDSIRKALHKVNQTADTSVK